MAKIKAIIMKEILNNEPKLANVEVQVVFAVTLEGVGHTVHA